MKLSLRYILFLMTAAALFAASLRGPLDSFPLIIFASLVASAIVVAKWINISKPSNDAINWAEFAIVTVIVLIALMLLTTSGNTIRS